MLHVTKQTMKKIAILITTLALFTFATAGCEETNTASRENGNTNTVVQDAICPDNASCQAMPDGSIIIHYNTPIALEEAIVALPSGYGISRVTAIENEHSFTVAFQEVSLDVDQIIVDYQDTRDENLEDLIVIQNNTFDRRSSKENADQEYAAALQEGVNQLKEIKSTVVTPDLQIQEILAKEM